jgi:hypothetical protein
MLSNPDRIHSTTGALLAKLFDVDTAPPRTWRREDFAAIYRHQMSAPVRVDLGTLDPSVTLKLRAYAEAEGPALQSFQDLFQHPNPPMELLELTKEFAKKNENQPDSALPQQVAMVFYFASVAAALARCGRRISSLRDGALLAGFEWARTRQWVDEPTRRLMQEGAASLRPEGRRDGGPA